MKFILPEKHLQLPVSLQHAILEKLSAVEALEKDVPSVLVVHDLHDSTVVYMSQRGREYLNVTNEELHDLGVDYYPLYFNPEDAKDYVPKILGLLERNNDDEMVSYFQQVRKSPDHEWAWFMSSTKIFVRDLDGNPLLTLTSAIPVDAQHHIAAKAAKLLEENNFLRSNHHVFNQLTKREKEILKLMAVGSSSVEIAEQMGISEATATTHRRNIKGKLGAKTNFEISSFARAFDLI